MESSKPVRFPKIRGAHLAVAINAVAIAVISVPWTPLRCFEKDQLLRVCMTVSCSFQ